MSELLGVSVSKHQIIMSHTPMQRLAMEHRDHLVLVVGNELTPLIAQAYGFKYAVGPSQFLRREPSIWPHTYMNGALAGKVELCPMPSEDKTEAHPFYHSKLTDVRAIFVFHDGLDWGTELQMVCDALRGETGRVLGAAALNTYPRPRDSKPPPQTPIFFTNPDFVWKNEQSFPRFGQGAFRMSVEVLYKRLTGHHLHYTEIGKPTALTYSFAQQRLQELADQLALEPAATDATMLQQPSTLDRIYMIGDNPASDIRGANRAKGKWVSVLVETGVFMRHDEHHNDPDDPAHHIFRDVSRAVDHILTEHV